VIDRLCERVLTGLALLLAALSTQVHAQSTPKTVTLVVPYAAGGGTDTVSRLISERMSRALGQTVIIENVVGGGSTLANDRVARSAPDGTTILINHVEFSGLNMNEPKSFCDGHGQAGKPCLHGRC